MRSNPCLVLLLASLAPPPVEPSRHAGADVSFAGERDTSDVLPVVCFPLLERSVNQPPARPATEEESMKTIIIVTRVERGKQNDEHTSEQQPLGDAPGRKYSDDVTNSDQFDRTEEVTVQLSDELATALERNVDNGLAGLGAIAVVLAQKYGLVGPAPRPGPGPGIVDAIFEEPGDLPPPPAAPTRPPA